MTQPADRLRERFGELDVYLFDQLLRGRIAQGMRVLDAGCGGGRNLVFLLREGFDVWGVDESADAVAPTPSRRRGGSPVGSRPVCPRTGSASSTSSGCRSRTPRWTR